MHTNIKRLWNRLRLRLAGEKAMAKWEEFAVTSGVLHATERMTVVMRHIPKHRRPEVFGKIAVQSPNIPLRLLGDLINKSDSPLDCAFMVAVDRVQLNYNARRHWAKASGSEGRCLGMMAATTPNLTFKQRWACIHDSDYPAFWAQETSASGVISLPPHHRSTFASFAETERAKEVLHEAS